MIKNKLESDYEVKKRGLNRMLEGIFTKENNSELESFLNKYPFPYYNVRDKSKSMGQFLYKITKEEVLLHRNDYSIFSVYESLALADEKLILQGDVQIDENYILTASLSDIKNISNRVAMQNPKYKITNIDLKEQREPSIKGLKQVIDYIFKHELFNVVVEFSLFEVPVGINKENILIWELRNY